MQATYYGWRLILWLCVAVGAHILVALFGVINRWLQVEPSPPLPAMRLALLISSFALASTAILDVFLRLGSWAARAHARRRRSLPLVNGGSAKQQAASVQQAAAAAAAAAAAEAKAATDRAAAAAAVEAAAGDAAQDGGEPSPPGSPSSSRSQQAAFQLARQQAASFAARDSAAAGRGDPLPPRPELPLARGLSRRVLAASEGRPRLVRYSALSLITVTFAAAYLFQITAPGFVDPSLVQLINMFVVIGVALTQSLLLHYRLPWVIWPSATVMLAGAGMVIGPAIGNSATGGLSDWRGWLGLGLALGSCVSTVIYFVSLQAFRRMGFTSMQLQYCYLIFSILLLLPLTLPVDGTDWTAQFATWRVADWAMLLLVSSFVCVGANFSIQHTTWRLGAPLVSMLYGLRLVATIVASQLLLGTTIVQTPLQIVGVVVTVCAVTAYMWWQWRASQSQHASDVAATAAAAKDAAAADDGSAATEAAGAAAEPPRQHA